MIVSPGFWNGEVGKQAESVTSTLGASQSLLCASTTDVLTLDPIGAPPASWIAEPGSSAPSRVYTMRRVAP